MSYAVDIVSCIDVTGSMTPIIDAVKANALRFYGDVQTNLTAKGKNVDELRVRVIAFRDFAADGEAALQESPFFRLPAEQRGFSDFVNGLLAAGGVGADHDGLRKLFAQRTVELEQRWVAPLDELDADLQRHERKLDELRTGRRERQARLWAAYKPEYERHLGPAAPQETP